MTFDIRAASIIYQLLGLFSLASSWWYVLTINHRLLIKLHVIARCPKAINQDILFDIRQNQIVKTVLIKLLSFSFLWYVVLFLKCWP